MHAGAPVGLIVIDLARRARMRVNGVVLRETDSHFEVEAREVYTNCPRYIQARAAEAAVGSAEQEPAAERSASLGSEQSEFIARADTFFIATTHPERGADASHRGGAQGFVRVEGGRRLVWPDYSGNAMFNTLGNLAVDPRAGLLFIDFEKGNTLQVSGRASVLWDERRAAEFAGAERVVEFDVEEVVETGIESVFPAAIIHRTNQWSSGYDRVFPGRFQPDIHFSTQADGPWLSSFKQFWDGLQSERVQQRKFLDTAVRRYSYAHERYRLEDKIVDLLIAAEALFLSDYKKDDPYIGEIRYRLSLRAAVFLGSDGESRRRIFRQMRAAYDLRSLVVHGGEVEKVKLPKQPDGGQTRLEDFVWTIQEHVRVALHKAIRLALQPETPTALVTWDELIFNVQGDKLTE